MDAVAPTTPTNAADILVIRGLTTEFRGRQMRIRANDDIDLAIRRGATLGIVGESGSGKSVLCRSILRLLPASADPHVTGVVEYEGRDLLGLGEAQMRRLRGTDLRMVFQNPMTSLNPVWPIGDQITEGLRVHGGLSAAAARANGIELLGPDHVEFLVRSKPQPVRASDESPRKASGYDGHASPLENVDRHDCLELVKAI